MFAGFNISLNFFKKAVIVTTNDFNIIRLLYNKKLMNTEENIT